MKEINVKVYEYESLGKKYYVYVKENEEFTQFYLQQENIGIIEYQVGIKLKDLQETIEKFIDRNVLEWIYFYNKEYGE